MKKIIIFLSLLFCITFDGNAQIRFNAYFDGYWAQWFDANNAQIYGNYEGFVIHTKEEGPWNYRFKFTIDKFNVPDKKQRKKDIKENKWYVFSGTVEYYISDDNPSALENFRKNRGPSFIPAKLQNGRPTKKITSKATIKVAAFKDLPRVYNIWYDNVGLGINLNTIYFSHEVEYK